MARGRLVRVNADQFRKALSRLDLSQIGAARLFGIAPKTVRNWARQGVPGTAPILLRLMLAGLVSRKWVELARDNRL
jgi:hypothetical protein